MKLTYRTSKRLAKSLATVSVLHSIHIYKHNSKLIYMNILDMIARMPKLYVVQNPGLYTSWNLDASRERDLVCVFSSASDRFLSSFSVQNHWVFNSLFCFIAVEAEKILSRE